MQDKVNQLLETLEQYEIISPVKKEKQPKGNTFISPVIILAKGESLKTVLDARYLHSLIDESKCNWPIEPIHVFLTKKEMVKISQQQILIVHIIKNHKRNNPDA